MKEVMLYGGENCAVEAAMLWSRGDKATKELMKGEK